MLAQDWPKSHGMTTVFKDYIAVERALDISASVCVNLWSFLNQTNSNLGRIFEKFVVLSGYSNMLHLYFSREIYLDFVVLRHTNVS